MNHRIRKGLLLGLSTSMLIATPALAGPPDGKGKNKPAVDANVSTGAELRDAINEGNAAPGPFVISLRPGTYQLGEPVEPSAREDANVSGDLDVLGDIVILGNGATIDLDGLGDRAFEILPGASLVVEKLTVSGADVVGESGGAFDNDGTLALDKVTATDNRVSGPTATGANASGGAIDNTGTLTIDRSTFSGNSATRAGGAIETTDGTVRIDRSELVGNSTGVGPGNGGALHVSGTGDGTAVIDRTLVSGNTAALEGGGLWAGEGGNEMTVTRSTITGNVANGMASHDGGGGMFNNGGTLVVDRSVVSDNTATAGAASGGGILSIGTLVLDRTEVSGNASARAGGGIEALNGMISNPNGTTRTLPATIVDIDRTELTGNTTGSAPGNGGGFHVTGSNASTTIDDSVVTGNFAANEGGGLWNFAGATMTVNNTVIVDNESPIGPNVFQNTREDGTGAGGFTVDGVVIPAGDNDLAFP